MPLSTVEIVVICLALGWIGSLVLPSLLAQTRYGPAVGRSYAKLAASTLGRPAITVNEHGDLLAKQLSVDDTDGTVKRTIGGVEKKFRDTADATHRLGTTPFALCDEVFGAVVDPVGAWEGSQLAKHVERGDMVVSVPSVSESDYVLQTGYQHYVRAVFEHDGERSLVSLAPVRGLIDGAEKSNTHEWIDSMVEKMFALDGSGTSTMRLLLPFLALVGGFVIATMAMSSGGGGGGGTTLPVGAVVAGWWL